MQQIYSSGLARSVMTRMKNDGLFLCYTYYLVLSSLFIADPDLHLSLSLSLSLIINKGAVRGDVLALLGEDEAMVYG